jgi:hypothetical protein
MLSLPDVGDLVYLPAGFKLSQYADRTVTSYCELKVPCVCLVVGVESEPTLTSIFYRGEVWKAPSINLQNYKKLEKNNIRREDVSHTRRSSGE